MIRDYLRKPIRAAMIVGLLTTALLLSACIEVSVESEFESDGSARHSISTLVEKSMLDDELIGEEINFDEIEQEARDAGLDAEQIETDTQVGVRISVDVEDNEDLGAALNELFNSMDAETEEITAFSGGFSQSSGSLGGGNYEFDLTVDGDALFAQGGGELDEELGAEGEMELDMNMMRQFFNMTYTVSMPGEITDHNGTEISSDTVRWDLPFEGSETFTAESEGGSGFPFLLIAGAGLGLLAVVLLIGGGVLLLRRRPAPVQPATAGGPAQSQPSTQPADDASYGVSESHTTETDPNQPGTSPEQRS